MKSLYFDCFSGVSGDMILGALVDSGVELETIKSELEKLNNLFKSGVITKQEFEAAKKKLLEYFDMLGFTDPNVISARRQLSTLMFK